MDAQDLNDAVRRELAARAGNKKRRMVEWSEEMPTEWRPGEVPDPVTGAFFTDISAWHLIEEKLLAGHPYEITKLHKPPGTTGYEMWIELPPNPSLIYVKLQFRGDKIQGRSFHISTKSRAQSKHGEVN